MEIKTDGKAIFTVFIGALIAVVFMSSIANSVVSQTETRTTVDYAFTAGAVGVGVELQGRDIIGTPTALINSTGDSFLTNNITITQGYGADGMLAVLATSTSDALQNGTGQAFTINYTYVPDGYLNNSGARSINKLVLIMSSLAIAIFVFVVFVGKGSLGTLMKRR